MATDRERVRRWRDIATGETTKKPLAESNIFHEGDRIYSWGRHFEMARAIRDKRGQVEMFLLNGDVFSVSTTRHQGYVREALRNDEKVIIPYSAMTSAGIDLDSVKILEVTPDRWEEKRHQTTEMPEGARWRDDWDVRRRERLPHELQAMVDGRNDSGLEAHERHIQRHATTPEIWQDPGEFTPSTVEDLEPHELWTTDHIRVQKLYTSARGGVHITVSPQEDGATVYNWTTTRHWLGESLIRAKVRWWDSSGRHERWATFLSGFDMAESRPLYFLAELPYRSKATTVAEAYEALKPEPVVLAEGLGREVQRQGDIFAVPVPSMDMRKLRAMGARIEKRKTPPPWDRPRSDAPALPYILKTNHTATEVAYLPHGLTLVRGTMYHDPQGRQPDHARHTLGKTWHVVVKNTVPTTRRRAA